MKKQIKNKLVPVQEGKLVNTLAQGLKLTVEQEQTLRANLPSWVTDKENVGTAMEQTAYEFTILIEQILQSDYGWSEKEIVGLETKLKKVLPVLHEMEIERNLSILSPKDMEIIGDIAEKRYDRLDKVDKHFFLGARKKQLRLKGGKK